MTGTVTRTPRRRTLLWLLVGLATALLVLTNRHELVDAGSVLGHADPGWAALLGVSSVVLMGVLVARHLAAQRALGVTMPTGAVVRASLGGQFVNSVSKSGGLAGLGVFLGEARRTHAAQSLVTAAYLLVVVFDQVAFALVLPFAVVVLVAQHRFHATDAVALAAFSGYLAVTAVLVVTAVRSRSAVRAVHAAPGRVGAWCSRRILRRPRVYERDDARADELYDAFRIARAGGLASARVLVPAIAVDLLCVVQLWIALAALGVHTGPAAPLVAYGVATLFATVAFLPGGIGLSEVSAAAVLHAFGVPLPAAAAAAICARVAEFWIPLAAGAVAAHGSPLSTPVVTP